MNKVLLLIGIIFAVAGIGLLIGDYFAYSSTREFLSNSRSATGVVEKVVLRSSSSSSGSGTYHPLVRFRDEKGQEIQFENDIGSNPPGYRAGESVDVLYKADNPYNAHINSFISLWFNVLLFSIMGGIFTLVGFGILSFPLFSKRKKEWLQRNGQPVLAEFQKVILDNSVSVNGNNPYRILSQWKDPKTNTMYVFKSESIWYDPVQYINRKEITVLIDPNKPKKHYMDISFLPKIGD